MTHSSGCAHKLSPDETSAIQEEIVRSLDPLAEALKEKNWPPILEAASRVRIRIKGDARTAQQAERFIRVSTAPIHDVRIIVETILSSSIERERAEYLVRIAALGVKENGIDRDGIIMDVRILFSRREDRWEVEELDVDCPPLWAQWNSRPNPGAPIQYADPNTVL